MRAKLKTIKNLNFDWMMKLKTNETLTKEPRKKIRNKKNKDWIKKKIWQIVIQELNWK
jgi:hypothetical protein